MTLERWAHARDGNAITYHSGVAWERRYDRSMSPVTERDASGHAVLFSESDDELVQAAAEWLGGALSGGGAAVVIATPGHRLALDERFHAAGVDLEAVSRQGSLIALDAAETLDRLTPGGSFDPQAFADVVGTIVRAAAAERPVRAFGEMVALLWEDGRVLEAIQLEASWDQLVQETSTSLLCAYPGTLVDEHRYSAEFESVCRLHSSVVSDATLERTWHFPADVASVPQVRRLVTKVLRARGVSDQALSDAQVVAAELVANGLLHGRSPLSVSVSVDRSRVHLQVSDESADLPTVRTSSPDEPSGRGLHLISALSNGWGVERLPLGKLVWAELPR